MITVLSLLHKKQPLRILSLPKMIILGWSFLGGSLGTEAPRHVSPSAPWAGGESASRSSAPAHQEIRSETPWKGGQCFNKAENTSYSKPQAYCVKNKPLLHTRALGALSRRGFSPHKDWYHGVKKESCHSQQGFQSERLHFQLPKSSCRLLLM